MEHVFVRVGSHRAGNRLARLLGGELEWWYSMRHGGGTFARIPINKLADARAIPSVTRSRVVPDGRCW